MWMMIGVFVVWLLCGLFACGCAFAHWQRGYPLTRRRDFVVDKKFAVFVIVFGPFGLLAPPLYPNFYLERGWLWPWSRQAALEAGALLKLARVEYEGTSVICLPGEISGFITGDVAAITCVKTVYMTPDEYEALPELEGF